MVHRCLPLSFETSRALTPYLIVQNASRAIEFYTRAFAAEVVLHVDDVDRVVEQAASAGAVILRPVKDEFYGDRTGMIVDPFGHRWHLATTVEEVSAEEMKARFETAMR